MPWRAQSSIAKQTPSPRRLSRPAARLVPESLRWRRPDRRFQEFGLPIVSRHPRHSAEGWMVRQPNSALQTIFQCSHLSCDLPHRRHASPGSVQYCPFPGTSGTEQRPPGHHGFTFFWKFRPLSSSTSLNLFSAFSCSRWLAVTSASLCTSCGNSV